MPFAHERLPVYEKGQWPPAPPQNSCVNFVVNHTATNLIVNFVVNSLGQHLVSEHHQFA